MTAELQRLAELLQPAKSIVIVVGENTTFDRLAAATSLALALNQIGKEASVYIPKPLDQILGNATELLQGSEHIKTSLGKQNLVISFEYVESAVENVSYAIGQDSKRFYLTIKPKLGAAPLDPATVEFAMAGTSADLIFLVGEHDLANLGELYFGYEDFYATTPLVTIHSFTPEIGNIHFNVSDFSSYSEAMTMILGGLQIDVLPIIATNLYAGMVMATKSFSELSVQADTFEIAAELLRRGARRAQLLTTLSKKTENGVGETDHINGHTQSAVAVPAPKPVEVVSEVQTAKSHRLESKQKSKSRNHRLEQRRSYR